jgi:phage baseplate assembly protein W
MAFVYESVSPVQQNNTVNPIIGLGVKIGNENNIFTTLYTVPEQAKENLKNLLLTQLGERYMLPEYGTDLLGLLFQPNTFEFKETVDDTIRGPISYWLPYIVIENIDIKTFEDDSTLIHTVEIHLTYTVQNFSTDTIKIFVTDNTMLVQ